jgi:hypothetical protein
MKLKLLGGLFVDNGMQSKLFTNNFANQLCKFCKLSQTFGLAISTPLSINFEFKKWPN